MIKETRKGSHKGGGLFLSIAQRIGVYIYIYIYYCQYVVGFDPEYGVINGV